MNRITAVLSTFSVLILGIVVILAQLQPDGIEIEEYTRHDGSIQYTVVNNTDNWLDVNHGLSHFSISPNSSLTLSEGDASFTVTEIVNPTILVGQIERMPGEYYVCLKHSHCPELPEWLVGEPFFEDPSIIRGN